MNEIIKIRQKLHQLAELSGQETKTSTEIVRLLEQTNPVEIIKDLGGLGVAAVYNGARQGKTIMIRAELDALPIFEELDLEYKSFSNGVSHKCGHDGHMAILIGLATELNQLIKNLDCRVVLLFQPAEETAQGAYAVVNDSKFNMIKPDYIFALHNLPGYAKKSIITKKGIFASASKETSHAGHPEDGKSPVLAMTQIINGLIALPSLHTKLENACNITIIHARLGEIAFGTSPGEAEIMATFRSHSNQDMEILTQKAIQLIEGASAAYDLDHDISWVEVFPATMNDEFCAEIINKAASELEIENTCLDKPFPWSEDFAWYTQSYQGAIFGLGAGLNTPQLHHSQYDFQDDIIVHGIDMFKKIILLINQK
jgi:amidohydrolase